MSEEVIEDKDWKALTAAEAPDTVYIVANMYFPKIKLQMGRGYAVETSNKIILDTIESMKNEINYSVYEKIKNSLKKRKWNEFKQLNPKIKSDVNADIILYAVFRHVLYNEPIAICLPPSDMMTYIN